MLILCMLQLEDMQKDLDAARGMLTQTAALLSDRKDCSLAELGAADVPLEVVVDRLKNSLQSYLHNKDKNAADVETLSRDMLSEKV